MVQKAFVVPTLSLHNSNLVSSAKAIIHRLAGIPQWLEALKERNVHVPESFERFCCVKICRDQSLKQEPVEPILDTSLDDEDSQPKDTVNSDAEEEYDGSSGISIS
ncbi:hypothetical protein JHK86_040353 [Glycine max]|nr:hypothetical protein JHK86_040353 [Glycine max]